MKSPSIPIPIRILTHNIRYATTSPFPGEEPWPTRKPRLVSELRFHTRRSPEAFICLQEVLHGQLIDILDGLNSDGDDEWTYFGVGRDDGHQAGEYNPVLYHQRTWTLRSSQTSWLSPTPHVPSKGWDAACFRIVSACVFRHQECGVEIAVMNTHLDDQGSSSRVHGVEILGGLVRDFAARGKGVLVAGDFNSEREGAAYRRWISMKTPGGKPLVRDLRDMVRGGERYGEANTFTGFGHGGGPKARIDFIFLSGFSGATGHREDVKEEEEEGGATVGKATGYAVLTNRFVDDGVYVSDHRAVVGDLVLS
ncbi:hypothetical protein FGG08_000052 [Glutinoglossum americanum]|uniref:Endonuclease/exonuclease/phosphatase domain-containing protein n=1 Tax=Glutinoglossum americanum TaxID=1670608 RepID=A0A9P8IG28_9PEZI|nr:hypothetical protein FGG08_000052 [Glutinoglossum americanum]